MTDYKVGLRSRSLDRMGEKDEDHTHYISAMSRASAVQVYVMANVANKPKRCFGYDRSSRFVNSSTDTFERPS